MTTEIENQETPVATSYADGPYRVATKVEVAGIREGLDEVRDRVAVLEARTGIVREVQMPQPEIESSTVEEDRVSASAPSRGDATGPAVEQADADQPTFPQGSVVLIQLTDSQTARLGEVLNGNAEVPVDEETEEEGETDDGRFRRRRRSRR
jgi:anti-sigma factor ChrR (cupin superfamily)